MALMQKNLKIIKSYHKHGVFFIPSLDDLDRLVNTLMSRRAFIRGLAASAVFGISNSARASSAPKFDCKSALENYALNGLYDVISKNGTPYQKGTQFYIETKKVEGGYRLTALTPRGTGRPEHISENPSGFVMIKDAVVACNKNGELEVKGMFEGGALKSTGKLYRAPLEGKIIPHATGIEVSLVIDFSKTPIQPSGDYRGRIRLFRKYPIG